MESKHVIMRRISSCFLSTTISHAVSKKSFADPKIQWSSCAKASLLKKISENVLTNMKSLRMSHEKLFTSSSSFFLHEKLSLHHRWCKESSFDMKLMLNIWKIQTCVLLSSQHSNVIPSDESANSSREISFHFRTKTKALNWMSNSSSNSNSREAWLNLQTVAMNIGESSAARKLPFPSYSFSTFELIIFAPKIARILSNNEAKNAFSTSNKNVW